MDDTLVTFGGAVKALGGGRIGGYGVLFSTSADPDLAGDYFTPKTDFGPHKTTAVYYDHGLDGQMGRKVLDAGATMQVKDAGIWVEAQLDVRDEYEAAILKMAEDGKLGWSSGTASHLVEREADGKAQRITRWPLGLDMSLTPTPCEPRTAAVPLKSLALERKSRGPSDQDKRDALRAAIQTLVCGDEEPDECYVWVCDVFAASVVWDQGGYLYEAPYSIGPDGVMIGAPTQVYRRTVYEAVALPAGATLDDQVRSALVAVEGLASRVRSVAGMRARDGRRLSSGRLEQVKALRDCLAEVLTRSEPPGTAIAAQLAANELSMNEMLMASMGGRV